jgi:secreted trypsin-like serine protease
VAINFVLRIVPDAVANRIIGGQWADYGQLPYQAGIYSNDRAVFCGGTLVTPDKVLTGGQCTYGYGNYWLGSSRVLTAHCPFMCTLGG